MRCRMLDDQAMGRRMNAESRAHLGAGLTVNSEQRQADCCQPRRFRVLSSHFFVHYAEAPPLRFFVAPAEDGAGFKALPIFEDDGRAFPLSFDVAAVFN